MLVKRVLPVMTIVVIFLSFVCMGPTSTDLATYLSEPVPDILAESVNMIENSGFETGSFDPWVNDGGTSYNQIRTDEVYSGTYSLFMDTHVSSTPYEHVFQDLNTELTLADAHLFSVAVYPTKVGNTAGQAGSDVISLSINNTLTGTMHYMYYEWSGYTYPGGDIGVNVTSKVMYLLFDLVPNQWNLIERDLLGDYAAFFGTPADPSQLVILRISLLAHTSNGDPGDFWVDDLKIGSPEEEPDDSNYVENAGFETGVLDPWVNEGETSYNQIVDTTVYAGDYSLYLDSHYSSAPYEPVVQWFSVNATLNESLTISAAIYPLKTGETCGQAGASQISIWLHNKNSGQYSHIAYEWSGYTFPGNDLNSNLTYARYLLFDWDTFEWNILNRSVYNDYVSFFGVPDDPSDIEFYRVHILCHSSNGDPGDFYIDDIFLGGGEAPSGEPTTTTTTTTTTTETTTTTTTTTTETTTTETTTTGTSTSPTGTSTSWTTILTNITGPGGTQWTVLIAIGSSGTIIIVIIVIILQTRRGVPGSGSPTGYDW